jgi:hypothetical protein
LITLVPVDRVDATWPHVRAALQGSCLATGGDISAADLWQGCRAGQMFLVVAYDEDAILGASVWRPEIWATGTKLRCMAVAGKDMKMWLADMRETATKIAQDCGATAFVTEGRKGWQRIFPRARVLRSLYEETI